MHQNYYWRPFALDPREAHSAPSNPLAGGEGR